MNINWGLYATLLSFFSVFLLLWGTEKGNWGSRQVSVAAVLTALCAAGRAVTGVGLLFLQPTMFLVAMTGFVYGCRVGFFVGALTPLISNFFMGQGPWTPWQMLCWGLVGVSGAALKAFFPQAGNKTLTVACFLWGYLYGAIMDIWQWTVFMRPLSWQTYLLTWAAGFGFDSLRAFGNLLFCAALGRQTLKIMQYFRKKMEVQDLENYKRNLERKKIFLFTVVFSLCFFGLSSAPAIAGEVPVAVQWSRTLGEGEARWLTNTRDGEYVLTGWTDSGTEGSAVFLVKCDGEGNLLWARQYHGNGYSCGYCVKEVRDGGLIVVGDTKSKHGFDHDVYVLRTDEKGGVDLAEDIRQPGF